MLRPFAPEPFIISPGLLGPLNHARSSESVPCIVGEELGDHATPTLVFSNSNSKL